MNKYYINLFNVLDRGSHADTYLYFGWQYGTQIDKDYESDNDYDYDPENAL